MSERVLCPATIRGSRCIYEDGHLGYHRALSPGGEFSSAEMDVPDVLLGSAFAGYIGAVADYIEAATQQTTEPYTHTGFDPRSGATFESSLPEPVPPPSPDSTALLREILGVLREIRDRLREPRSF